MDGVIVIDKPQGFTSFDAVAVVRGCMRERRTGHTGTLDPMATGVLPVLLGMATKSQILLPDSSKAYIASFRLGLRTDTLDITGSVLEEKPCDISADQIESVLSGFRGDIMQTPPMYSAVQKDGVRLYDLARQGIEVERESRQVTVNELELTEFDRETQSGTLSIDCSKGTYIRVICDDIGRKLGCGCVMTALRRTRACGFSLENAVTIDRLREMAAEGTAQQLVLPTDSLFEVYPKITVSDKQAVRFGNGAALMISRLKKLSCTEEGSLYRVYGSDRFLGLGVVNGDELAVKKLFFQR